MPDKTQETKPALRRGKAAKPAPVLPEWTDADLKKAMEEFQAKPKDTK